jgi:hypothetical protein
MSDYTEHARLSPSGSKKWMACPGSITLEELMPPETSIYADEGTACHTVAARCLTEHYPATKWVGHDIPVNAANEDPRFVEFTEEMAELVQEYVNAVKFSSIGCEYWVETRVEFSEYVGVPGQFGTADFACYNADDKELQVDDAKFGHREVGVEENSQLMFYALGMYGRLELSHDIQNIRLRIHQPKVREGPIEWTCTLEELLAFGKRAWDRAQLVELAAEQWKRIHMLPPDHAELDDWYGKFLNPNPNEDECAFCRAMATCPAARRKVEETVGASFDVIAETKDDAKKWVPPPGFNLDVKMAAAGFLEDYVIALRAAMEGYLLSGGESTLFGLELGRQGHRRWSDADAAEKMLREQFRLTIEDAYNLKVKSPTQIEKLANMDKASLAKAKKHAKKPETTEPLPPPVVGPVQWKRIGQLIVRNPAKPSVKLKDKIKTPYTPPALDGGAFQPAAESDDDDDLA